LPAAILFMLVVFVMFWHELRWYHMAAAALYLVNYDFTHPWFIGHLWSLSVQEQFYFLWPSVLKKWHRQRVLIVLTAIAVAPIFRVICHFLGTRGRTDEFFPAVADILAIGCLLAFYSKRMPKIQTASAAGMIFPVLFVPLYMGVLRFHTTALLLFVLWPLMHFSIAGLLLHVVQRPYWILNVRPLTWLGQLSYGLYGSSCLRLGTSAAVVLSTARGRNCSGLILSTGAADNPAARTK
jgi:peptidoglycan/LPS O-acetylase OafA/YrhL